jgi:hypothetical protein
MIGNRQNCRFSFEFHQGGIAPFDSFDCFFPSPVAWHNPPFTKDTIAIVQNILIFVKS